MTKKKAMSRAMLFILLFGIVSMFSDMTKESAESIRGAFLSLMGASAATIGLVSGLGELVVTPCASYPANSPTAPANTGQ